MRDPSQREPEKESLGALAPVDRYVTRWRNSQEAVASVTIAIRASGQRSGSSRSSPAPSRYTRSAMSIAYRNGLTRVKSFRALGMLLSGVASPDKRANGIITRNE